MKPLDRAGREEKPTITNFLLCMDAIQLLWAVGVSLTMEIQPPRIRVTIKPRNSGMYVYVRMHIGRMV